MYILYLICESHLFYDSDSAISCTMEYILRPNGMASLAYIFDFEEGSDSRFFGFGVALLMGCFSDYGGLPLIHMSIESVFWLAEF